MAERSILNIAAYKFVTLDELVERRVRYLERTHALGLRGTILLADEGINLFIAGDPSSVATFLSELQTEPAFAALDIKRSYSARQPFTKMRVKLKREIVALKRPDIRPDRSPAPRITPAELKRWLDAGRDLVLLDTRNQFEFDQGTFDGAQSLALGAFSELPERLRNADPAWKSKTVVTFCTGGIRCEKAAPLLIVAGFRDVLQLDGGILRYFEECGSAHYSGDCFVFDARVALDNSLAPVATAAEST